jgi:hypothetical protein
MLFKIKQLRSAWLWYAALVEVSAVGMVILMLGYSASHPKPESLRPAAKIKSMDPAVVHVSAPAGLGHTVSHNQ